MKKLLVAVLAAIMTFGIAALPAYAGEVNYEQPFDTGTQGSEKFRIPAILTLNNGSVLACADKRYGHGADSPNNLDTLVAVSHNGYDNWKYETVNHFDDYDSGFTDGKGASFIDSAVIQSKESGRVFIITTAFPSGGGVNTANEGSGYIDIGGKKYAALTDKGFDPKADEPYSIEDYAYYIGDFSGGFASVFNRADSTKTEYSVDEEFNLYLNGDKIYVEQAGSDKQVQQNVFYKSSDLSLYRTTYLWMRYSDDNAKSWSSPMLLNSQVKNEEEGFLGVCPGRGAVVEYKGKERILFTVYNSLKGKEKVSAIFSDDNGLTWNRSEETDYSVAAGKTSESQIINLPNGDLRMFSRNKGDFIAWADSSDGGQTWGKFRCDEELKGRANCMSSFINLDKTIDGKAVVAASYPSDIYARRDGVIKIGLIDESNNEINWHEPYRLGNGTFAYSCLTQLSDGNVALLWENEDFHIQYTVFSVDDNGKLSEINGNDFEYTERESEHKAEDFFRNILYKLQKLFNVF